MRIIEYRKHLINGEIRDPEFVRMGGWWADSNDTYISVLPDTTPYYVPDSLTELTDDQLVARVQELHQINPYPKHHGNIGSGGWADPVIKQTNEEVEAMVREWLADLRSELDSQ